MIAVYLRLWQWYTVKLQHDLRPHSTHIHTLISGTGLVLLIMCACEAVFVFLVSWNRKQLRHKNRCQFMAVEKSSNQYSGKCMDGMARVWIDFQSCVEKWLFSVFSMINSFQTIDVYIFRSEHLYRSRMNLFTGNGTETTHSSFFMYPELNSSMWNNDSEFRFHFHTHSFY